MITEMKEHGDSGFCDLISKLSLIAREYRSIEDGIDYQEKVIISKNLKIIDIVIEELLDFIELITPPS